MHKIGLKSLQEYKQTTFSDAGFLGVLRVNSYGKYGDLGGSESSFFLTGGYRNKFVTTARRQLTGNDYGT